MKITLVPGDIWKYTDRSGESYHYIVMFRSSPRLVYVHEFETGVAEEWGMISDWSDIGSWEKVG